MISGFWGYAAKITKHYNIFQAELENQAHLALDAEKGNGNFREIYHPISGKPDGGWQSDHQWKSCDHQTWSATAFTRLVLYGLIGINFEPDGIAFTPYLPKDYYEISLDNIKYRGANLTINVKGIGDIVKSFTINGKKNRKAFLSAKLKGNIFIEIEVINK